MEVFMSYGDSKKDNYLLREAETVIENYVRELKKHGKGTVKLVSNFNKSKRRRQNIIINAFLVGSIILFLIMIFKFM